MSEGQYEASLDQLNNLKQVRLKPHILDKETIERIIKLHQSQNKDSWVFFEQCKKWRSENPTQDELKLISRIEKSIHQLEETNIEIITLANDLKDKTIDHILEQDDFALGLDYLMGQLQKEEPQ